MPAKTMACRLLDTLKISYTLREYRWTEDALDAATVAGKIGLPPRQVIKTLVLRGDRTGVLMACLPADRELDLKALASCSGNKKVQPVTVKELPALTGYVRGGVSPLGTSRTYPLYVDVGIEEIPVASISAGRRGLQILLLGSDLMKACGGRLEPITLNGTRQSDRVTDATTRVAPSREA